MMWTTDADGADHVREPGLAALHRARRSRRRWARAGRSACTPTTPRRCWRAGRRRSPSGAPWEREYRLKHHTGEYRWIHDRGVPRYVGEALRRATWARRSTSTSARRWRARLLEVYEREHRIAETLQRSLLPERLPPIEGVALAARYLPGARGRRHRRRLVRRAGAARRARGARGGRRGRPRAARGRLDGPAPQRVPRLRDGRGLARRGGGADQPARDERRGAGDGHACSTWCSTARAGEVALRAPPATRRRS